MRGSKLSSISTNYCTNKTPVRGDSFSMWARKKNPKPKTDHWGGQSDRRKENIMVWFLFHIT